MSSDQGSAVHLQAVDDLQKRLDRLVWDAMDRNNCSVQVDMRAIEAPTLGRRNELVNEMYPEDEGTLSTRAGSLLAIHRAVERASMNAAQRENHERKARRLADGVRDALRMPNAEYYSVVGRCMEDGLFWSAVWFSIDRKAGRCVGITAVSGDLGFASHAERAEWGDTAWSSAFG